MPYSVDDDGWIDRWRRNDAPLEAQIQEMRAWLKGLEIIPEQAPSEEASMSHPVPDPDSLRAAYVVAADAVVVYTVDEETMSVRVNYLAQDPPEYMD